MAAILKKHNGLPCLLIIFVLLLLASSNANSQVCSEFNSGSSQSALDIKLDKNKYFEITYSDIARTKKDDFALSFTPPVKQTLRSTSKNSNQILSLIIKYDKSESGRPPMVPLIRFFVQGTLGTTNLKAESSNVDDCKEVHNFNISVQEAKELFQNNRLDFDLLINVLNQGPANRLGQRFRITICLNCISSIELTPSPSPTPGMVELPPDFPTGTPTVIPPTPNIEIPPEGSITWVITDGPGKGIQIHSKPNIPNVIEPDFNKTTNAIGSIENTDQGCEGPLKHYHGELNEEDDPAPDMCGWGHVEQAVTKTETSSEDTLPEDSTTWIIIDGTGEGIQIHSEPGLPTSIEPDFNKTTSADGSIADPDECEGPFKHYHGELNSAPDPNPTQCGWGHVIEFTKATEFTQFASAIISLEERAGLKIIDNLDIDGAIKDLEDAISQMEELIRKIKEEAKGRKLDPVTGERSEKAAGFKVKKLRGAIRFDKAVLKKLNTLKKLPEYGKTEDPELKKTINEIVDEIAKLFTKAFDLKQDMFKRIAEEEFLAPHP